MHAQPSEGFRFLDTGVNHVVSMLFTAAGSPAYHSVSAVHRRSDIEQTQNVLAGCIPGTSANNILGV